MVKKKKKISLFDTINIIIMLAVVLIIIYPLYYTVIASISDGDAVALGQVIWKPVGFTLEAYKQVFAYEELWIGYSNSIIYTIFGTLLTLVMTIPVAYAFSKKYLPYRKVITTIFLIPAYISGGMIPLYLVIKNLRLLDTRLVLILCGGAGVSLYNTLVTRTYFENSIPESLYEAAEIDGAGEFKKFFRIAIPLAKPVIAVIALYVAVGIWNNYMSSLLYVSNDRLYSLQMVLRQVLVLNENILNEAMLNASISADAILDAAMRAKAAYTMKYALVFIASAPLLCIYPFIQKYFVKGVMIGSVKG